MSGRKRESAHSYRDAEALLDGTVDDGSALARLLAAARAPGHPADMAGLDTALTAFTTTGPLAPIPRAIDGPATTRTVAGRSVVARAVALAAGGMLAGSAAFAAVNYDHDGTPPAHGTHQVPAPVSAGIDTSSIGGVASTRPAVSHPA